MPNAPTMNFSLLDRLGVKADVQLYVAYNPATATPTTLATAWVAYGDVIDAATSSQIVGGHILIPQAPDGGWKDAPADNGNKNNEVVHLKAGKCSHHSKEIALPSTCGPAIQNFLCWRRQHFHLLAIKLERYVFTHRSLLARVEPLAGPSLWPPRLAQGHLQISGRTQGSHLATAQV